MILGDCIASGHPEFMGASRALQKDGEAIISKRGIYRMHLGSPGDDSDQYLSEVTAEKIQNLDITFPIIESWGYEPSGLLLLEPFMESHIRREHCNVVLLKVVCISTLVAGIELLKPLWRFGGFKKVSLRIEIDEKKGLWRQRQCPCLLEEELFDDEWMRNFFILRLGKAEIVKANNGFCITLDPEEQARAAVEGSEE